MPDTTPTGDPSTPADTSATPPTGDPSTTTTNDQQQADLGDAGKRALAEERKARRDAEAARDADRQARADAEKAHKAALTELDKFKRQSMSDHEKAIDDARTQARSEATKEFGSRLAAAEVRAAAAGRLPAEQLSTLLEHLDLGRFVGDDGTVDAKAVAKFVDSIAPAQPEPAEQEPTPPAPMRPLDIGQGARATPQPLNGPGIEDALRRAVGA